MFLNVTKAKANTKPEYQRKAKMRIIRDQTNRRFYDLKGAKTKVSKHKSLLKALIDEDLRVGTSLDIEMTVTTGLDEDRTVGTSLDDQNRPIETGLDEDLRVGPGLDKDLRVETGPDEDLRVETSLDEDRTVGTGLDEETAVGTNVNEKIAVGAGADTHTMWISTLIARSKEKKLVRAKEKEIVSTKEKLIVHFKVNEKKTPSAACASGRGENESRPQIVTQWQFRFFSFGATTYLYETIS